MKKKFYALLDLFAVILISLFAVINAVEYVVKDDVDSLHTAILSVLFLKLVVFDLFRED